MSVYGRSSLVRIEQYIGDGDSKSSVSKKVVSAAKTRWPPVDRFILPTSISERDVDNLHVTICGAVKSFWTYTVIVKWSRKKKIMQNSSRCFRVTLMRRNYLVAFRLFSASSLHCSYAVFSFKIPYFDYVVQLVSPDPTR